MDYKGILSKMSLSDKIALCSGADFWLTKSFEKYGIPALMVADGPHGLCKQENAVVPSASNNVPVNEHETFKPTLIITPKSEKCLILVKILQVILHLTSWY